MSMLSKSLFIATASALVGVTQSADNSFPDAELFRQAPLDANEEAWGFRFVQHVGVEAHLDRQSGTSSWPLASATSIADLARAAARDGMLRDDLPNAGDVFVLWSPAKKRYVRVGLIVEQLDDSTWFDRTPCYRCLTIEAVTSGNARKCERSIVRRERVLLPGAGDRIIRWTDRPQKGDRSEEAA